MKKSFIICMIIVLTLVSSCTLYKPKKTTEHLLSKNQIQKEEEKFKIIPGTSNPAIIKMVELLSKNRVNEAFAKFDSFEGNLQKELKKAYDSKNNSRVKIIQSRYDELTLTFSEVILTYALAKEVIAQKLLDKKNSSDDAKKNLIIARDCWQWVKRFNTGLYIIDSKIIQINKILQKLEVYNMI